MLINCLQTVVSLEIKQGEWSETIYMRRDWNETRASFAFEGMTREKTECRQFELSKISDSFKIIQTETKLNI